MMSQCPKKKVHVVEESVVSTTTSPVGSQETVMVGSVESFNLGNIGNMRRVTFEDEKVCSMGVSIVREGESVDIEIDSGAEVSCLPVNIGADTYPLHETKLSMRRGYHVAAGGV